MSPVEQLETTTTLFENFETTGNFTDWESTWNLNFINLKLQTYNITTEITTCLTNLDWKTFKHKFDINKFKLQTTRY